MSAKILVVDDDPILAELVSYVLRTEGYEPIVAVDGPDGVAKFVAEKPDLVVLDVTMPRMDGFEVCERLRKKLSLPLVSPSPSKKSLAKPITTEASAIRAPLPHSQLAQAKVHRLWDPKELKKLDPAKVQILDLHSEAGAKIPAAIFKQLPQLGLLALNLKRNRSFSLPEEVFQCPHLQVLGLNDTYSTARARLNPSLPQLTQLRALDLAMCRFQGAKADEALRLQAQLPELQTLDGYHFCDYFPESFTDLRKLRHLCVAGKKNRWESWRQVPLQSISTHEPVPEFGGGPFEFYEGPLDNYGSDIAQLRFAATFSETDPTPLKGAKNLRGLVLSNLRELPTWLEQLSNLEFLEIQHYYSHLKFVTKNFAVLGRLTGLKCLILRVSQNWQVPVDLDDLDLSALAELRWLSVNSWSASHPTAPLPKGIERLANLRYFHVSSTSKNLQGRVPAGCQILSDPNWWDGLESYRAMFKTSADPEWWLSRFRVSNPQLYATFASLWH